MMKHQPKYSPKPRTPRTPRSAMKHRSREQTEFIRTRIQNANEACQSGEFEVAIELFTEIITLEPSNSILYCNRSAAYIRMQNYNMALVDALKTIELDPEWHKGYYRQGIALQCMGRHPEALAAYASALAHDEKSQQLLQALVEAALKSNLQDALEPLFEQLDQLEMSSKAFATVALIGQELLAVSEIQSAITVLESALNLGTDDLTLKGSVYSALSGAYWKVGNHKRALHYMHQDLLIVESLKDDTGIARVHGNLGNAYYSQNSLEEAAHHHRLQLDVASKLKDRFQAANALSALGHIYVSQGEHENALASHKRCALLWKQLNNAFLEARELGNVGTVYALMGDFENAISCQEENLCIMRSLNLPIEVCKALSSLGNLYHNIHNYEAAVKSYQEMFELSKDIGDADSQCKALSGLGNSFRMQSNLTSAERCHEQQLKIAIDIHDRDMECRAQGNLGVTYQYKGDFEKALEFHKAHLSSCNKLNDKEGEGRAYGNIGSAYQSLGHYKRAVKYHKLGLSVARDLNDQLSEATLHGNIAVAFQSLEMFDEAEQHYMEHLKLSKQIDDLRSECIAESNLGNLYGLLDRFNEAVTHYENFLSVATKLNDKNEMCKATHNLAYAFYKLQQYTDSIENYERNITLAFDLDDRESLQQAYCNLGLAYLAMNDFEKAVRCQKLFLASAREGKNVLSVCKAFGNLGTIYMQMGDSEESLAFFHEQVRSANTSNLTYLQADCYHQLAKVLWQEKKYDEAKQNFDKELLLRRELNTNIQAYYQCLTAYGAIFEELEKYSEAYRCYCEMFQLTKKHCDAIQCSKTCDLMGNVNIKMCKFEKAISAFRLQLECITDDKEETIDVGRIHVNISKCCLQLKQTDNAIHHLLEYQGIASRTQSFGDEHEAYTLLSEIHKETGNYQEALMYCEKRLVTSQELSTTDVCESYADVAMYHWMLENFDSAISYYEQLIRIAREENITEAEYNSFYGLGNVYTLTKEYVKALNSFESSLKKAEDLKDIKRNAESCMKLGDAHQNLDNKDTALNYYKQCLEMAENENFELLKIQACGRLGRLHHLLVNRVDSLLYLHTAAKYSEETNNVEEKIIAFYRLALKLYFENELIESRKYFEKVISLVEESNQSSLLLSKQTALQFVTASYQMLQKVLIMAQKPLEALFVAEKANSINLELLLRKTSVKAHVRIPLFEKFQQRVQNVGTTACFYSIAVGQLYCWLLRPNEGYVKFWKERIIEKYTDSNLPSLDLDDIVLNSFRDASSKINIFIEKIRKSIDVQQHEKKLSDQHSNFASQIDIIDNKANRRSRIGLPVLMSSINNTNPYQFCYRNPAKSFTEIKASRNLNWQVEAPLGELHKLLISQIDNYFIENTTTKNTDNDIIDLTLILPRELSLIPFTLLKDNIADKFLYERYRLSHSPTLFWLLDHRFDKTNIEATKEDSFFIFGGIEDHSTQEAIDISRIFGTSPVLGSNNAIDRDSLLHRLSASTVCHLTTDTAWQTPSFVLPHKDITKEFDRNDFSDPDIENFDTDRRLTSPSFTDIFMTVKDISELKFNASLFTFGIAPSSGYSNPICPDGLHLLVTSLLMTGCKTLLTSLWPVPDSARRFFLQKFYQLYNKGIPAYEACCEVVTMMQKLDEYRHPCNWSGFIIYGQNTKLYRKIKSFTEALHEFLQHPNRDAIKVILHLVEKARQRLAQERRSTLYVAEESIMKKIQSKDVVWRPILISLGFRFEKEQGNMPDSVYFPGQEHSQVLNSSSNTLYAFLGLSRNGLDAIAKLCSNKSIGEPLKLLLDDVLYYFNQDMSNVQVPFQLSLWRTPGCHEFLSSLGFDVMGVGKTEVMLRSGKINMRRTLQCASQVLKDLFELDQSRQMEHLVNSTLKTDSEVHITPNNSIYLKKTQSETAMSQQVLKKTVSLDQNLNKCHENKYLRAEAGLFGSKEIQQTTVHSPGGIARRLRSKTNEESDKIMQKKLSLYGLKPEMKSLKHYGTMDKIDVSDLVMTEQDDSDIDDDWNRPIRFFNSEQYLSQSESRLHSPDALSNEDVDQFSQFFRNGVSSKLINQTGSLSRGFSNVSHSSTSDRISLKPISEFAENYLTSHNRSKVQREGSNSSEDSKNSKSSSDSRRSRTESEEDIFAREENKKPKMPAKWKRLHLSTDYFDTQSPIKTITIRDSLKMDAGAALETSKHAHRVSNGLKDYAFISTGHKLTPKGSPEQQRGSKTLLDSSGEQDNVKKKGWFKKFRNKKRHSVGDLLDLPSNLESIIDRGLSGPSKSEGDINFNIKNLSNQTEKSTNQQHYGNLLDPEKAAELSFR